MREGKYRKIFFGVAICIILFLFVEFYSRTVFRVDPTLWAIDENLGFRYVPDASGEYCGARVEINSKGLRDVEYSYSKKDDIFRIVVLGDSLTFGVGIGDLFKIYPKVIEKQLMENNYPVEVINLGVSGYNTVQEVRYFKEEGIKYEPDLVVVGFVPNDNDPLAINIGFQNLLRRYNLMGIKEILRRHVYTISYIIFLNRRIKSYLMPPEIKTSAYDSCIDEMIDFAGYLKDKHIGLMVFLLPYLENFENYPYADIHSYVKSRLGEKDILCYDLYPYLRRYPYQSLWISRANHHPNEKCHRYFADYMTPKIINFLEDRYEKF